MNKILILDFGSQTTALIGRRIRELGVYTEIVPGDTPFTGEFLAGEIFAGTKGIILSGSPESVYSPSGGIPDQKIYGMGLPLLGICYGLQRMSFDNGGTVKPLPRREYGGVSVTVHAALPEDSPGRRFLNGFAAKGGDAFTAWMSHGDTVTKLAPGFVEAGTSGTGYPAIVIHREKPWFGLQFHPEVSHCERGAEILASFVFGAAACKKDWNMETYVETQSAALRVRAGTSPVLLLVSGGVDSTVAAALLLKTLPSDQVHLMYMDTGLMRKDETAQVSAILERLGARHLHIVICADEFLEALQGTADPEKKRTIIGDLFIKIQEREVVRLALPEHYFLAQGTLYTDLVESGRGVGTKAHVIKSHHNVASPLVDAKRREGRIIEPLDRLYKDEVRALGRLLGIADDVTGRHPFPGPGLAVRILGEVTRENCELLRETDAVFIAELKNRRGPSGKSLYDEIWQAFAVLLPVRSVGVAGDGRAYGSVAALRAVVSADGMTADVYPFPPKDLAEIAAKITNTVPGIGRVVYDISSKPPATIEWE